MEIVNYIYLYIGFIPSNGPEKSDSDNQSAIIAGIVVSFIVVLMIILLGIFRAKLIQCLESVWYKTNEQKQEETTGNEESESTSPKDSSEVASDANRHVEPELDNVHIMETRQEQQLDEGLYTELDISIREPENVYQPLEHRKGDQENKIYENIDDYETMA